MTKEGIRSTNWSIATIVPSHGESSSFTVITIRPLDERSSLNDILERDLLAPIGSKGGSSSSSRLELWVAMRGFGMGAVEELCDDRFTIRPCFLCLLEKEHLGAGNGAPSQDGL